MNSNITHFKSYTDDYKFPATLSLMSFLSLFLSFLSLSFSLSQSLSLSIYSPPLSLHLFLYPSLSLSRSLSFSLSFPISPLSMFHLSEIVFRISVCVLNQRLDSFPQLAFDSRTKLYLNYT